MASTIAATHRAGVALEFMPNQNSALVGNGSPEMNDAARLEIAEQE